MPPHVRRLGTSLAPTDRSRSRKSYRAHPVIATAESHSRILDGTRVGSGGRINGYVLAVELWLEMVGCELRTLESALMVQKALAAASQSSSSRAAIALPVAS